MLKPEHNKYLRKKDKSHSIFGVRLIDNKKLNADPVNVTGNRVKPKIHISNITKLYCFILKLDVQNNVKVNKDSGTFQIRKKFRDSNSTIETDSQYFKISFLVLFEFCLFCQNIYINIFDRKCTSN